MGVCASKKSIGEEKPVRPGTIAVSTPKSGKKNPPLQRGASAKSVKGGDQKDKEKDKDRDLKEELKLPLASLLAVSHDQQNLRSASRIGGGITANNSVNQITTDALGPESDHHSHSMAVERSQKSGHPSLVSNQYSIDGEDIELDEKRGDTTSRYEELDTLLTIPFFEELGSKNLKELRSIFQRRVAQPGDIVMHEGTKESCFHIIIQGKVEVLAKSYTGAELVPLREIGKGEFFGDLVLVADSIQPVTVRALEPDTTILYIRTEDFSEALSRFPELSVSVDVVGRNPPLKVQLKKIPFFADVGESKLHILGTLCEVRKFVAGTVICEQGSAADGFYHIIQGRVEISVQGQGEERGSTIHLDTLKSGEWFGEIALLEQTRRTATVIATQDCIVLFLSKQRFDRFLRVAPEVLESGVFDQLVRKRTANTLKAIPLFAGLKRKQIGPSIKFDEARLAILGQLFRFNNVDADKVIFREGDLGEAFYIILKGSVVVMAKNPEGNDIFLAELRTNDWFGESSLLNNARCNATVIAKTNCILLKLMGENFQQFLRVAPEVEQAFRARMGARTADRLRKIPFFNAVRENKPWSKLDLLGGLFNFEEMLTDQVVFCEGEIGDKFYLIVSGQVEVCVKRADSFYLLDTLGPDDWFGEIALLRHTPRTATVTCKSDCVFLTLTSDKFLKFLTVAPELTEHFQALLQHRTANILKTMDLFKYLNENKPWSKVEMMGALFNYELKKEGDYVYKEGDVADRFYLLMSGRVKLSTSQESEDGTRILKAQAHFGEADILSERKRKDTVMAMETSILLYINSDAFYQLMKVAPELKSYFGEEEAKRKKRMIAEAEKQKEIEKQKELELERQKERERNQEEDKKEISNCEKEENKLSEPIAASSASSLTTHNTSSFKIRTESMDDATHLIPPIHHSPASSVADLRLHEEPFTNSPADEMMPLRLHNRPSSVFDADQDSSTADQLPKSGVRLRFVASEEGSESNANTAIAINDELVSLANNNNTTDDNKSPHNS